MSKENEKKESILKSGFFLRLFGIPYATWFVISLLAMIPDETDPDPLSWGDLILTNIVILLAWFGVSFVISLIINEVKKSKPKTKVVKEIQYMNKPEEKIVAKPEELKEEIMKELREEITKEAKKETKKNVHGKCLYTCDSIIDAYEYKKMANYFPQMYWHYVIIGTVLNLIITAIIAIAFRSLLGTLIFFAVYQTYLMILYKVRLEHYAEKTFNSMLKNGSADTEIHTEFYDDYFIRQGETETLRINYDEIDKCVETDTNFYLKFGKRNKIIFIQKNACDLELISFLREKFKVYENHLGETTKFKGAKKYHNPNFIKTFMIILFIITICSLWGALWSVFLVDKINPQHGFNFTKNTWVFWCWLPIPILSIILGFKYKNAGFKCTKNIVGGFIIGFLLLVYGSFSLFPTFSQDYSKIDSYRSIISAQLPSNGELEIQDWETYFDEDKTNYTIINAYYDKEDVSSLVNSIEYNSNWILSKEIKSELKILIPSQLRSDDDAYFSIYNKTTNQYNVLPEIAGEYEIYAMKYDKSDKHLEIHKFNYLYK